MYVINLDTIINQTDKPFFFFFFIVFSVLNFLVLLIIIQTRAFALRRRLHELYSKMLLEKTTITLIGDKTIEHRLFKTFRI